MREIAHAEDMTKFNAAVDKLKELPVWNEKKPLRDWFVGTWLKQQKVLYFCPVSGSQSFWNAQENINLVALFEI